MTRTKPKKIIALIDLDAFFAQIEQFENPEYRNKPIIIGGRPGGRGVVATASYEARKFGIHSAMPSTRAHQLCPDGIFVHGNMEKYRDYSQRIFDALHDVSPEVEQASIDEFYVDLSGLEQLIGNAKTLGQRCKQIIKQKTGLTCSVGIGPNRLIAKLASEYRKPDGLTVVAPSKVNEFLDPMPIKNLRGVGPKTLKHIEKLHVKSIGELRTRYSLEQLQKQVGNGLGKNLYYQSRGQYPERSSDHVTQHSISKETTFETDISDPDKLKQIINKLAFTLARSLRKQQQHTSTVAIKVRLADFTTYTRQATLSQPTDSDRDIAKTSWVLFEKHQFSNKPLRLIGVGVNIDHEEMNTDTTQLNLFTEQAPSEDQPTPQPKDKKVTTSIDSILDKFGEQAIRRGS